MLCFLLLLGTAINLTVHERRTAISKLGLDHAALDFLLITMQRVALEARDAGNMSCVACVNDLVFERRVASAELCDSVSTCYASTFPKPHGNRLNRVALKLRLPLSLLAVWGDCVSPGLPKVSSASLKEAVDGSLARVSFVFGAGCF